MNGREYLCVECKVPNCAQKRLGHDNTVYYPAPNGTDGQGNLIQVDNCTVTPKEVSVSNNEVYACGSFKPMDAA